MANVGHNNPRVVEAISEQVDRFSTRLHGRPVRGLVELAESSVCWLPSPARRALRSSTRSRGGRERRQLARLYTKRQASSRSRGRPGRTWMALDDLEDASVQEGPRAVRADFTARRTRTPIEARMLRQRSALSSGYSPRRSRPIMSRRSCSSRSRARVASCRRPRSSSRAYGRSATGTASCSLRTRCKPGSGEPGGCSRWSTSTSRRIS